MAAKKPADVKAFQVAREFIQHVDWMEDHRGWLHEALSAPTATAENVLSAVARLHYELGQLMLAERDYRRKMGA